MIDEKTAAVASAAGAAGGRDHERPTNDPSTINKAKRRTRLALARRLTRKAYLIAGAAGLVLLLIAYWSQEAFYNVVFPEVRFRYRPSVSI